MAISTTDIFIFIPLDENISAIYRKGLDIPYIFVEKGVNIVSLLVVIAFQVRETNRPFTYTEDCYKYNCFCACDGSWNCPKDDTEDICDIGPDGGKILV